MTFQNQSIYALCEISLKGWFERTNLPPPWARFRAGVTGLYLRLRVLRVVCERDHHLYMSLSAGLASSPTTATGAYLTPERLVFYCRTTSASTAPHMPQRTCCPCAYVLITVPPVSRSCELTPETLRPTPCTLHPRSCTLHSTPCTLQPIHHTPYTTHHTPHTIHHTPYNLHQKPYTRHHTP